MEKTTSRSIGACERFLLWAQDHGFTMADGFEWSGVLSRYAATCPKGHECSPVPSKVQQGRNGCAKCGRAGQNRAASEAARVRFLAWVQDNGFALAEPFEWSGATVRYKATCDAGHPCTPLPSSLSAGQGGCGACQRVRAHQSGIRNADGSVKRTDRTRLAFLKWADDNGFTLAHPFEWRGVAKPYAATCANGHECNPRPNSVQQGQSGCGQCFDHSRARLAGPKSQASRALFLGWAAENGYTLAEPFEWRGTMKTYAATCPQGHACNPRPTHVKQGIGGCGACQGKVWDAFYVVYNPHVDNIKFGVTSGDPRPRLRDHRNDGYTEVLRTFAVLPEGEALGLEQELMKVLKCAGVAPVQGREYFPGAARNVILGFVDEWLA